MKAEVRYFASLVDCTGTAGEQVETGDVENVEALWEILVARHPGLSRITVRPMVALDRVYARWDASLDGVREIAFLPPVSGG